MKTLKDKLVHHVSGAIERGEKNAITSEPYNGWKNYETWNVALWIQNDEGLYSFAKEYRYRRDGYTRFVESLRELGGEISLQTPDGVAWNDSGLDIEALNELVGEL